MRRLVNGSLLLAGFYVLWIEEETKDIQCVTEMRRRHDKGLENRGLAADCDAQWPGEDDAGTIEHADFMAALSRIANARDIHRTAQHKPFLKAAINLARKTVGV